MVDTDAEASGCGLRAACEKWAVAGQLPQEGMLVSGGPLVVNVSPFYHLLFSATKREKSTLHFQLSLEGLKRANCFYNRTPDCFPEAAAASGAEPFVAPVTGGDISHFSL